VVAGRGRRQPRAGEKGGSATGPSPVDRARNGSKQHLLVEGGGIPLAWALTGGNRHDSTQLIPLVDRVPPVRGKVGRPRRRPECVTGDRAYDYPSRRRELRRRGIITVIRTPIQAPNANAHAERWVRTLRADCLDRILILGRRHLEHVLRIYRRHYNEHRPHRALRLLPPNGRDPTPSNPTDRLRRRDLLGGLIREYVAA
jgi:hypothetical protein